MTRSLALLALLFLPLIRGGYVVTVTGDAKWEQDFGPVSHRRFALLKVICEKPFPIFRHNSESPQARTDAQGQFRFEGVEDGIYVLAISHPLFGWVLLWQDTTLYRVEVEGESVEMGVVRVGVRHVWGE